MSFAIPFLVLIAMSDPSLDYAGCTRALEEGPEVTLSYAERWESLGGGDEAVHCRAMAYIALDMPEKAAALVESLARNNHEDAGVATRLYVQAAEAWMAAGEKSASYAALREAYGLTPDAAELHMASATIYATGEQWEGVVLTLTALERHASLSADALALRARAKLKRNDIKGAQQDTVGALKLDPLLIDALVMRGELASMGHPITDDPFQSSP